MAEVQPRGTPLDKDPAKLSLLSYNLLAPAFVRPIDKRTGDIQPFAAFQWAEPASEVLDWDVRRPRLLALLSEARADILCLQEVQFDSAADGSFLLPAWLYALQGYDVRLPAQNSLKQMAERNERVLGHYVAIGCAVLYRRDRLIEVDESNEGPNTLVGAYLRGAESSPLAGIGPFCVFSVHLDAQSEEKRVDQFVKCLTVARKWGTREVVVAGDLNTECLPGSCVAAFVADAETPTAQDFALQCASALRLGIDEDEDSQTSAKASNDKEPSAQQLQDWETLWRKAASSVKEHRIALSHVKTGPTRASFDHGKTEGPCVSWRLDHILYTARTLKLVSSWAALESDPYSVASGLPNHHNPSDHLPVAAVFEATTTPSLDASQRQALLERLAAIEARHEDETKMLEEELSKIEPKPSVQASPVEDSKGKAKKSSKPPPEVIAFIQEKRKRLRDLKAQQSAERASFLRELGELDVDAVESILCTVTWVESGERQKK